MGDLTTEELIDQIGGESELLPAEDLDEEISPYEHATEVDESYADRNGGQ